MPRRCVVRRSNETSRSGSHLFPVVLIALLAGGVYANSVVNEFVFDDRLLIEKNQVVHGEGNAADLFVAPYHGGLGRTDTALYRPLTLLSFVFNYAWGGLDPFGYHLVNILLHVAVSLLVFRLGLRVALTPTAATAGALLFAVHPVHTEVVANLAGRAELLSALFFLLALLAYARSREGRDAGGSKSIGFLALACLAYLFALFSKENAVTFLGVVLLWDFLLDRSRAGPAWWNRLGGRHLSLLLVLIAYLSLRWVALGGGLAGPEEISHVDNPLVESGPVERWATASVVAVRYLGLLVFPLRLSPDYSYAQVLPVASAWSLPSLGSILMLGILLGALVASWRRRRVLSFLGFFSIVTFSITSNFFVVIGTIMAERLLYLPSVGFCLLAGYGLQPLARLIGSRPARGVLFLVIALASVRTVARNRDWRDGYTLFSKAARTSPRSVKVLNNLGAELTKRDRLQEAREALTEALSIEPEFDSARINLAQCLMQGGELEGAEKEVRQVLAGRPEDPRALFQLAEVLHRTGRQEEAERALDRLLILSPAHAAAHERLGAILVARGDVKRAESEMVEALRLSPESVTVLNSLGLLYRRTGRLEDSVRLFREAVRLSPDAVPLHNNLANALRDAGRLEESRHELETALGLQPGFAPTHYNLGLTHEIAGRPLEAGERYRRALELEPGHGGARRALGRLALGGGDLEGALDHLDEAVRIDGADEEAHALRARASFKLARYDQAEADYLKVLELNPGSVEARNSLGVIYALRGDVEAARRQWEEALRLAPGAVEIQENLRKLPPPRP